MGAWSYKMTHILDLYHVPQPEGLIKTITPLGDRGAARHLISLGVPLSVEEVLALMDESAIRDYTYTIPAKPYVKETLLRLRAEGHRLNVLTASPHRMLDVCLKRLGLYDLFDNIWSCDDFDYTKSQPEIYVESAARLGVPVSACVFLDDNPGAVATAKKAGMTVIAVYDETSADSEALMRRTADRYIRDFREL